MSKIIINNMSFTYKEYYQPIFNNVNITLDTDWKLGLIGRNGRGKTTLLRLLSGEMEPDRGSIITETATELFPYRISTEYQKTMDVIKEYVGYLKTMEDQMEAAMNQKDDGGMELYQQILTRYLELDGYLMESRIKKELALMKLPEKLLDQDFELLSGGEKTKMQIIALFLRKNPFVLLDEPTNHLDFEGKQVLADYLRGKKGFLVVSHDRAFVDEVADHILSINKADIAIERGNYSSWKMNKDRVEEYELRTKEKLEKDVEHLEKISVRSRNWASVAEKQKSPFATNNRGNSTRAARFMRQAKAAEQTIRDNIAEKKNLLKNYEVSSDIILKQPPIKENLLISAYGLSFGYSKDLLFTKLTFEIQKGDRVWIRGRNGAGKSTLLKLIGKKIPNSRIAFANDIKIETAFQEPLWTNGMLKELISAPETKRRFVDICHLLDISHDTMQRPLETLSSGEQKKIDIARALASPSHVLLLDEPLNFCDICFREQLEKAILTYQPTIVFVEHDEWFGKNVATKEINL